MIKNKKKASRKVKHAWKYQFPEVEEELYREYKKLFKQDRELKKNYNTEWFGLPNWRWLVSVVSEPAGGANIAHTNKIVENHKAGVMPQWLLADPTGWEVSHVLNKGATAKDWA